MVWIRRPAVLLTALLLAATCCGMAQTANLTPSLLRCEYRVNPLGVDDARPRLSWILTSPRRGARQTAYHILVAGSPDVLQRNRGDLWDTGRVPSAETIQIAYAGKPLASGQRAWWKVRSWDAEGRPSAWSKPAFWQMGLLKPTDWRARWIGCDINRERVENPVYLPCPYVRKAFRLLKPVRRATLTATAAGLYEVWLNSRRVGQDLLTPGWTEYHKRLYYQTYDVTGMLKPGGENVVGAILGDGWYGLHHGGRGQLGLLAQMNIEYSDGTRAVIGTDDTWKTTQEGPIRMADIYNGETYDARREMPGWCAPGFDDSGWQPVVVDFTGIRAGWKDVTEQVRQAVNGSLLEITASNAAFGDPAYGAVKSLRVEFSTGVRRRTRTVREGETLRLSGAGLTILKAEYGADAGAIQVVKAMRQAHPGSPVRRTGEIQPVSVKEPKAGVWVYDLGQNFSGWARLKAQGAAGQKVTLRFAEMLNPDGTIYTTNLRAAKCTDSYTLKGGGTEIWEPRFTFHGFRYVEVTGYPGSAPPRDAVTGVVVHSDAPLTSAFVCSNPLLNRLFLNTVWGQRSNYLEVPTDCPQRDERMGWSGDAQVFVGTAAYNMDIAPFFTAWMNTFNDSQDAQGGYPNVSPKHGGVSPAWGDAGVICPWTIHRVYGDRRILARHYEGMVRWIEYLRQRSSGLLRPAEGFGDWLNLGADMPKDVIATAYFAHSTRLLAEMAQTLGRKGDAAKYRRLFNDIRAAYNRAYVGEDGRIKGDTQTTYLIALGFDLLPAEKRTLAAARLVEKFRERDKHISTGFLGVNLLLPVLTSIGREDLAWTLLTNETYPSWLYSVTQGATTIWERWDGWTQERGFQDPGMNSFNHYAYGSSGEWMMGRVAGIDTDGPAYRKIIIRPRPGGGVDQVRAHYDSIRGRIATVWTANNGEFRLDVTIPANTTATVYVPTTNAGAVTEGGTAIGKVPGVRLLRAEAGAVVYAVGSGTYRFTAPWAGKTAGPP